MKQFLKENFVLVAAFALPVLLILVVALSIYLPPFFVSTQYNFIYTSCADSRNYYPYDCNKYLQQRYSTVNNRLIVNNVDFNQDLNKDGLPDIVPSYTARIFFHDTQKNESREITLVEAQALMLNNLLTSPDGVTVSGDYNRGGGDFFLFGGGSSSYGYYLTKGNSKKRLNLINNDDQYYYQNNFQFLGWVLPGRN